MTGNSIPWAVPTFPRHDALESGTSRFRAAENRAGRIFAGSLAATCSPRAPSRSGSVAATRSPGLPVGSGRCFRCRRGVGRRPNSVVEWERTLRKSGRRGALTAPRPETVERSHPCLGANAHSSSPSRRRSPSRRSRSASPRRRPSRAAATRRRTGPSPAATGPARATPASTPSRPTPSTASAARGRRRSPEAPRRARPRWSRTASST